MIVLKELIGEKDWNQIPIDHQFNLMHLHLALNRVRQQYAKPMVVTSGYRSKEDQFRIYKEINDDRKQRGLPELRVPLGSMHLRGAAADIADPDRELASWCKVNETKLYEWGLWVEDLGETENGRRSWVHLQVLPPRSGSRFFLP